MPDQPKISTSAVRAMIIILVTLALLSLYANIQRWRRASVETVVVTPVTTASPLPSGSPSSQAH